MRLKGGAGDGLGQGYRCLAVNSGNAKPLKLFTTVWVVCGEEAQYMYSPIIHRSQLLWHVLTQPVFRSKVWHAWSWSKHLRCAIMVSTTTAFHEISALGGTVLMNWVTCWRRGEGEIHTSCAFYNPALCSIHGVWISFLSDTILPLLCLPSCMQTVPVRPLSASGM